VTATSTDTLKVAGLRAELGGTEILHGIDLEVPAGQVHVVMGPNGSGKSTLAHALMGRPGTNVTAGSISIGGTELAGLPSWQRARAGLFLALQQPIEIPGVRLQSMLAEAVAANAGDADGVAAALRSEADAIGFDRRFIDRALNVDLSGGERKRSEVLQFGVLRPAFAILDELDSGLDVDGLRAVGKRVHEAVDEWRVGVLAITHYRRLLTALQPDVVHVFVDGRIVESGGPELAETLESTGYGGYGSLERDVS